MSRLWLVLLLFLFSLGQAQTPFKRGINLTGWLQKSGPRQIHFTEFGKQDFEDIKSLGCDVIRLPINLHAMAGKAPDYAIDPLFFYFLDQIVTWAEELQMHLILDNHTFDPDIDTSPDIGNILVPVWRQLADHYKDRSTFLYYEILNEPHGIADLTWNTIQQSVIEAIRQVDQKHTIIVGPAEWNSYSNLKYMPAYEDTNLIYTFHFYDPFLFTHQGAGWTDMGAVSGIPFPYDLARMPALPPELNGTWIQGSYDNYNKDGSIAHVKSLIDIAAEFRTARNIRIFCGEFGVFIPNSPDADRNIWYQVVRKYMEEKNIAWTTWDYKGGFGLFEAGSNELFDYDLNIPLIKALGLNPPEQKTFELRPDSTRIKLYDDYIGPAIREASWGSEGTLDYYSENNPHSGRYCVYWSGAPRYGNIALDFSPYKDLSFLANRGYVMNLWVKGDTPGARIDLRFVDTKNSDPQDHPWRMHIIIDETLASWDDQWHQIRVPLSEFTEAGAWDNDTWYEPKGDFDWSAVFRFEIVAEYQSIENIQFWFDDLAILNPDSNVIFDPPAPVPAAFQLNQNYPNPFNSSTTISFILPQPEFTTLKIYNVLGAEVATIISHQLLTRAQNIYQFDGSNLAGGVYYYKVTAGSFRDVKKMILLK